MMADAETGDDSRTPARLAALNDKLLQVGTKDGDILGGGDKNDVLDGGKGSDTAAGGKGDDWIMGGEGSDSLAGGAGKDKLFGGDGNDVVSGGEGDDDEQGRAEQVEREDIGQHRVAPHQRRRPEDCDNRDAEPRSGDPQ